MENFISAVLGELITRSINFIVNKYSKPPVLAMEDRLERALLRAQVIVDEAMRRRITNRAMLQQLDMLRDMMHQGYYMLDTFRYLSRDKGEAKDQIVSKFCLSKVNSVKDICLSSGTGTQILEEMQEVLERLSSRILDANDLVLFLASYPRMYREPYSMHLLLSKYMFCRQMETELVISFLLHRQPRGTEELEVLPIVGPGRVGKSTLVAHVCNDERVRDHFLEIIFLTADDYRDGKLDTLKEGCAKKYQRCTLNRDGRMLVVVELGGDFDEGAWKRLYSASKRWLTRGSKIIITSRSNKITKFGTTQTVTLKYLSNEAWWYFFKTLTFGSTDPAMHPRLIYLATEIARALRSFVSANIMACLLRDNFDIGFWCNFLAFLRGLIQRHVSRFGEHPGDVLNQNRPAHLERMVTSSEEIIVYYKYKRPSQEEVPKIMYQDVAYGSVKPRGKFEALAWRSQIPPYHNYVYSCEIRQLETTATKRKRAMRNGVTTP